MWYVEIVILKIKYVFAICIFRKMDLNTTGTSYTRVRFNFRISNERKTFCTIFGRLNIYNIYNLQFASTAQAIYHSPAPCQRMVHASCMARKEVLKVSKRRQSHFFIDLTNQFQCWWEEKILQNVCVCVSSMLSAWSGHDSFLYMRRKWI